MSDDRMDDRMSNVRVIAEIELGNAEMRTLGAAAEQLEKMAERLRIEDSMGHFINPVISGFTTRDVNGNHVGILSYRFDFEGDPEQEDGT